MTNAFAIFIDIPFTNRHMFLPGKMGAFILRSFLYNVSPPFVG